MTADSQPTSGETLEPAPVSGLESCPSCDYSLRGLPAVHHCPECHFAYDPHATAVDISVQHGLVLEVAWGGFVLLYALAILVHGFQRGFRQYDVYILASLGMWVLYAIRRLLSQGGVGNRLLINGQGVRFRHPGLPDKLIGWASLETVSYSWITGKFYLRGTDGETLFKCPYRMLGNSGRVAKQCAQTIEMKKRAYDFS